MREEKRTVISEKTVYISSDGTEFDDLSKCVLYEKNFDAETMAKRITEALPQFEYSEPFGSDNFHWGYVEDFSELGAFIRFWLNDEERSFSGYDDESSKMLESLRNFPQWVVAIVDDEGYGGVYSADEVFEAYSSFTEAVKQNMKLALGETSEND